MDTVGNCYYANANAVKYAKVIAPILILFVMISSGKEGSAQLTSLYQPVSVSYFYNENIIYLFTKQATLMRRSTVLSHPLQLVFPNFINSYISSK